MARAHEDLDERLLHRMLFFTDAVFAIVMTVLVLELRPPEAASLAEAARAMAGKLFAFGLSFAILAIFWVAHMSTTRRLERFDWPTTVANLAFLFPICLIPFVSAWVGDSISVGVAWRAYCVVLIAVSLTNIALVLVQSRGGGRLIAGGFTRQELAYRLMRAGSPGLAFAIGLVGASLRFVFVAQLCWVLIPVFIRLSRLAKPKPAAAA